MTAISAPIGPRVSAAGGQPRTIARGRAWREAALVIVGLAAIVTARWAATRVGLDALAVGAAFGLALLALLAPFAARSRTAPASRQVVVAWTAAGEVARAAAGRVAHGSVIGVGLGLVLVAATVAGPAFGGVERVPGLGRTAAAFAPWALITGLVAIAEEVALRGVLLDRLSRAGGVPLALVVTSALFALMHVPVYGWHVVPLDLGVGLALGGIRLATRTVAAPVAAHVVADLATWWL